MKLFESCTGCNACLTDEIRNAKSLTIQCGRCGWRMKRNSDGQLVDALSIITAGKKRSGGKKFRRGRFAWKQ